MHARKILSTRFRGLAVAAVLLGMGTLPGMATPAVAQSQPAPPLRPGFPGHPAGPQFQEFVVPFLTGEATLGGGFLGVQVMEMNSDLREYFGAPTDAGVLVEAVVPDSPADAADVRVGDVVVTVNGASIDSAIALVHAVRPLAGETVTLGVFRDRVAMEVTVELPAESGEPLGPPPGFHQPGFGPHLFEAGNLPLLLVDPDSYEQLEERVRVLEGRLDALDGSGAPAE